MKLSCFIIYIIITLLYNRCRDYTMLTQRHSDAPLAQLPHHRLAAGQLRRKRHYGNVVQAAVDLHQVLEASGLEGAEVFLRVGSFLLGADERTLQVKTCTRKFTGSETDTIFGRGRRSCTAAA